MILYNTCTTKAHTNEVKQYEILVWAASVILYKRLGYTLKLYCATEDIPFLKRQHLYELYDEINTDCFDNNLVLANINLKKFWSSRKLEAMKYELAINPDSVYSDTDILMYKDLNFKDNEALFWTQEPPNSMLYLDWNKISKPEGEDFEQYKNTTDAYNCGIMWFKDKKLFDFYYQEYKRFVINNPCTLVGAQDPDNNVFACNAEQRLLKAICDKKKVKVGIVSDYDDLGIGTLGTHLFMHKRVWINMPRLLAKGSQERLYMEDQLNLIANCCFKVIQAYDQNLFEFFKSKPYFKTKRLTYYG